MSRRHAIAASLAVLAFLLPAVATAAPTPSPNVPAAAATAPNDTTGVRVGPAPPAAAPDPGSAEVNGAHPAHPHFWDLPGRIRQSIDDWFRGLALDALTPMLDLIGKTVLATPQLEQNSQVAGLWQISLVAVDGLLVLFLLIAAGLAMSYDTLQSQYALKDLLRRLAFTAVVINTSLSLSGQLIALANGLAAAFLGDGASAAASAGSLQTLAVGALSGGGIFLTLLGLACAVVAVVLVVLYLFRTAIVVLLICAAPLLLLCHLFPQTEGLAQLWWRALAAALTVQVAQAIVLAAAVRVFFAPNGGGLGLAVSGSVINLLLCLCLLVVLVKVPFWAKQIALGSRGASTTIRLAKTYASSQLVRTVI